MPPQPEHAALQHMDLTRDPAAGFDASLQDTILFNNMGFLWELLAWLHWISDKIVVFVNLGVNAIPTKGWLPGD